MDDAALLARAARQYGIVERNQALALGFNDAALEHRVAAGRLVRVHPGVYRDPGAPRTREQRLLAACLAAGSGSAVSHRSAAQQWALALFPDVVEIVTPRAQWPRLKDVRVHRSTDLRPEHVTVRFRIPTTKPLRTLVDLGQSAPWAVAGALELGLANGLFGIRAADAALDEFSAKGRTGVGVFRRVIDNRALERGIPDGLLEPRFARLCRRHGVPMPAFQHWVTRAIRVDFAYPDQMIVIEVDGFDTRRTPAELDRHAARQNELVLLGWTVLRFSWKHVVRQPDRVAAEKGMTRGQGGSPVGLSGS